MYAEAKSKQLDVPALKAVVAYRRQDPSKRADLAAVVESYLAAMSPPPAPNKRTTDARKPAAGPSKQSLAHAREATPSVAHDQPLCEGDGEAGADKPSSLVPASTISDDLDGIPPFLARGAQ